MIDKAALIALTLQTCPWIPEPLPALVIYDRVQYFQSAAYHANPEKVEHARGFYTKHMWYGFEVEYIVLHEDFANERLLCHEWRHAVEPEWRHE